MNKEFIDNNFVEHPAPAPADKLKYDNIRDGYTALVAFVEANLPVSDERNEAMRRLWESLQWCNAAVTHTLKS